MQIKLDVNKELGKLMKAMRHHKQMRQQDMAKSMNMSRGQIANLEGGAISNILLKHLVRCGEITGFDVKLTITKKPVRGDD